MSFFLVAARELKGFEKPVLLHEVRLDTGG